MKRCPKCKTTKTLNNFCKDRRAKSGFYAYCRVCSGVNNKIYRNKNREKYLEHKKQDYYKHREKRLLQNKVWRMNRFHGITLKERDDLIENQEWKCAICKVTVQTEKKEASMAVVDHDHKTGKMRGILCDSCNRGIGLLKDNPEILINAAKYLLDSRIENINTTGKEWV